MNLRERLKRLLFEILGKDPEAVVIVCHTGDPERATRMEALMRELTPGRDVVAVFPDSPSAGQQWLSLNRRFERKRVALAAVLFDGDPQGQALRTAALCFAPGRVLAFHRNLERHHLSFQQPIASLLFLRGVPLDRIFLRPRWLTPFRRNPSSWPREWRPAGGRGPRAGRQRVAVLSPYLPYPLSHGGAVRLWNLLRIASREFDLYFFGFEDGQSPSDLEKTADLCAALFVAAKPRYREPRWSSLRPPEVCEFHHPVLASELRDRLRMEGVSLLQTEYTQMAAFGGDILVEHDVTQDLHAQVFRDGPSLPRWWDLFRWRRFENRSLSRARHVIVMSGKDQEQVQSLLGGMRGAVPVTVAPSGVDLQRFRPSPEPERPSLLFVGSFRHFPNVDAYQYFFSEVWPLLTARMPGLAATVVAGPDPHLYCHDLAPGGNVSVLAFVPDVAPLYAGCTLAIVPTRVSAGTNLKALEAMAAGRAIVSTPSGVAGLGLRHGESVWIAGSSEDFAEGVVRLLQDRDLRHRMAGAAHEIAVRDFGWDAVAERQAQVWRSFLPGGDPVRIRPLELSDLPAVEAIQKRQPSAAQWDARDYLYEECCVAECAGIVRGFLAFRTIVSDEAEVLNLAVDPDWTGRGLASRLLSAFLLRPHRLVSLEVRASNRPAQALYQKHGFRDSRIRKSYYSNPVEDGIVMTLQKW